MVHKNIKNATNHPLKIIMLDALHTYKVQFIQMEQVKASEY